MVERSGLTREEKRSTLKGGLLSFMMVFVAVWALLPIFWGATYKLEYYFPRLNVDVYDFDSASTATPLLGPMIARSLVASQQAPTHFTVRIRSVEGLTPDQVGDRIVSEDAWAAVVINANATSAWETAMRGEVMGEYDGTGAMAIVFASARFFQVIIDYVVPFIEKTLAEPISMANKAASAQFLAGVDAPTLAGLSRTQLQALATPFGYREVDVRNILPHQWSGAAPLEAGLIYFVIFAFQTTLFYYFARQQLRGATKKKGLKAKMGQDYLLRIGSAWFGYFFLSLWYSLLNVAFKVPMNGNGHTGLNSQSGFMVFWMLNWLTMAALGLAMEAMISLLTIKFFPLFLICWIILNISVSFFPPSLMTPFYRYGYAMPFWHTTTAYKYIFWGARNRLGLNFGVLVAWVVLNHVTLFLFDKLERRRAVKEAQAEWKEKGKKSESSA